MYISKLFLVWRQKNHQQWHDVNNVYIIYIYFATCTHANVDSHCYYYRFIFYAFVICFPTPSFIIDVFMHCIQSQIVWRNVSSKVEEHTEEHGMGWDGIDAKRCFQESSNVTILDDYVRHRIICMNIHIYIWLWLYLLLTALSLRSHFIQISGTCVMPAA